MIDISHQLKPGSVELLARANELPVRTNRVVVNTAGIAPAPGFRVQTWLGFRPAARPEGSSLGL